MGCSVSLELGPSRTAQLGFWEACRDGRDDLRVVVHFLKNGADAEETNDADGGHNAVYYAARSGSVKILKYLVSSEDGPRCSVESGGDDEPPLCVAAAHGQREIVNLLTAGLDLVAGEEIDAAVRVAEGRAQYYEQLGDKDRNLHFKSLTRDLLDYKNSDLLAARARAKQQSTAASQARQAAERARQREEQEHRRRQEAERRAQQAMTQANQQGAASAEARRKARLAEEESRRLREAADAAVARSEQDAKRAEEARAREARALDDRNEERRSREEAARRFEEAMEKQRAAQLAAEAAEELAARLAEQARQQEEAAARAQRDAQFARERIAELDSVVARGEVEARVAREREERALRGLQEEARLRQQALLEQRAEQAAREAAERKAAEAEEGAVRAAEELRAAERRAIGVDVIDIDIDGGPALSIPAAMILRDDIAPSTYRPIDSTDRYETPGGVAVWAAERPVLADDVLDPADGHAGRRRTVLYRVPLRDAQSVLNFRGHLVSLARLMQTGVPSIAPVAHVMFDGPDGSNGGLRGICELSFPASFVTLDHWLEQTAAGGSGGDTAVNGKPVELVRQLFSQLVNAVQLLHSRGIVGCLHRNTVRVQALDGGARVQVMLAAVPIDQRGGIIPELPSDGPQPISGLQCGTAASDMYLVGCWMFEALFGREPILVDTAAVEVPVSIPGAVGAMSGRLRDLLSMLLRRDPTSRITAFEFAAHPAMTASLVDDMCDETVIVPVQAKFAVLWDKRDSLRTHGTWRLSISRVNIVDSTADVASSAPVESLRRREMRVSFEGEAGIDAGGLTKELFHGFFTELFESDYFESPSDAADPLFLPSPDPTDATGEPQALDPLRRNRYEGIGRMLAKCIFDKRPVPARFAPSLYKYLLGRDPNVHDLESFAPEKCKYRRLIMGYSAEELEDLVVDFSRVGGSADRDLTIDNRVEYVTLMIPWELVGCRRQALEAIKRGFDDVGLTTQLGLFTVTEVMTLVCGDRKITAEDVVDRLVFRFYPPGSQLPEHFKAAVRALAQADLRRFLVYVTAQAILPPDRIGIHYTPDQRALYTAHTCSNTMDVPDINDASDVKRRLRICLDNLEDASFALR